MCLGFLGFEIWAPVVSVNSGSFIWAPEMLLLFVDSEPQRLCGCESDLTLCVSSSRLQLIDDLSYEDVKKCYRGSVRHWQTQTQLKQYGAGCIQRRSTPAQTAQSRRQRSAAGSLFFLVAAQVSSDYFTVGFCRVNAKARNLTLHSNHDNSI